MVDKVPYLHKEHLLVGDEGRMQGTIDYWWNHINGIEYKRFQEHFTGRICDIGCNIGMSSLLAASDPKVQQVVGVDINVKAVEAARRYTSFAKLDNKVVYIVQDFTVECSQLETESFDGAVSFHTLEHIYPEDLGTFVANLWRILKMGGKALISIPNGRNYNSPEHVNFFDRTALRTAFVGYGFDVLDIHLTDSQGREDGIGLDTILTGLFIKPMVVQKEQKVPSRNIPWIPHLATQFLDGYLIRGMDVFEWGSGGSTLYFVDKECNVISVEHVKAWYDRIKPILTDALTDAVVLHVLPASGAVAMNKSDPKAYYSQCMGDVNFRKYAGVIDDYGLFDLVFVDGRARPSCLLHGHKHVKPGGFLFLDNSDRAYYLQETARYFEGWDSIVFHGHGPYLASMWEARCWKRPL